jgi:glutaredoxin
VYIIYGKKKCGFCAKAIKLLQSKGFDFIYTSMDNKQEELVEMALKYRHETVPLIIQVVDGDPMFIGGYDNLCAWIEPTTEH